MKTRIFPGATENEKAIFAFLLASLEIHGADSAEMFEGIEGMTITAVTKNTQHLRHLSHEALKDFQVL